MVKSVTLVVPGSRHRQHWIVRSIEVGLTASAHFGSGGQLIVLLS